MIRRPDSDSQNATRDGSSSATPPAAQALIVGTFVVFAAAVIDSQTVRPADTVPTASSGYDGGKKIKGRKRHVAVGIGGLLLAVVVTTASVQDRDGTFGTTATLREALSTITLVWADAGHAGRFIRDALKMGPGLDTHDADAPARCRHDAKRG